MHGSPGKYFSSAYQCGVHASPWPFCVQAGRRLHLGQSAEHNEQAFVELQLMRGMWSLGLGQAAARLQGSRSLMVELDETGYSYVQTTVRGHSDAYDVCGPSCGACLSCLLAAQVATPGSTEGLFMHSYSILTLAIDGLDCAFGLKTW